MNFQKRSSLLAHPLIWLLASLTICSTPSVAAEAVTTKPSATATAIFAGGCFWCLEADFEKLPGVISAESGYTAGRLSHPTYEQVSTGGTGHTEAVRVNYDPRKVSTNTWSTISGGTSTQQPKTNSFATAATNIAAESIGKTQQNKKSPKAAAML